MKYCIDCVFATKIFPHDGAMYWRCDNPKYVTHDPVDKSVQHFTCSYAREKNRICGYAAAGFVPAVPEFEAPVESRLSKLAYRARRYYWRVKWRINTWINQSSTS